MYRYLRNFIVLQTVHQLLSIEQTAIQFKSDAKSFPYGTEYPLEIPIVFLVSYISMHSNLQFTTL